MLPPFPAVGCGDTTRGVAETYTLREAAERVSVSPPTLRRWADAGLIPELRRGGVWTPAEVSHARIVARLRARGHSLDQIRRAGAE